MPLPEQISAELDAMDAAVRGEPVDPEFAELAELALLLAAAKPELPVDRAVNLDRRVNALAPKPGVRKPARRPWLLRPAFGAGLAVAAVVAVLVIVLPRGGSSSNSSSGSSSSGAGVAVPLSAYSQNTAGSAGSASSSAAAGSSASSSSSSSSGGASTPTPQSNGRRIEQADQLELTAPRDRIGTVAEELFSVVGSERGIVQHSQVTSGSGGYASFTLSIPSSNLSATLARLAELRYARIDSSTASTSDVNSQYLNDERALGDAKALRTSLLTQLEEATTTSVLDSLKARLTTAEATIASDESRINSLQSKISFSAVSVQINPGNGPSGPVAGGGSFTLKQAGHDAVRVLVVAGGVLLIALAVLVPLGLVVGLIAWLTRGWRRRSREHALDAAT